jgi:hypothetical protein
LFSDARTYAIESEANNRSVSQVMISGSISGAAKLSHVYQPALSRLLSHTVVSLTQILLERRADLGAVILPSQHQPFFRVDRTRQSRRDLALWHTRRADVSGSGLHAARRHRGELALRMHAPSISLWMYDKKTSDVLKQER